MDFRAGWITRPAWPKAAILIALAVFLASVPTGAQSSHYGHIVALQEKAQPHHTRTAMTEALEATFLEVSAEETERQNIENWLTIGLFLFIVACSLIFEMAFDSIEEFFERRGMTSLTKMLRGAYKELTILGFISLTLFAVVRSGQMQRVNDKYLGVSHTELAAIHEAEEAGEATPPPTHLTEIFEEIHILIFVVMSIFLLSACILTARGYRLHRKHEYLDAKTETDLRNDVTMLEREGGVSEQHVEESLTYWGIRQRFLKPRIPTIPKPRARYGELPDFSFAAYISHAYGDTLTEMVELPPSILVLSFLIVLLLRPALDLAGREVIAFMILVAFALLGMTLLAYSYVRHVTGILDPDPKKLRSVFGAARVSAEQLQEALDAPVDRRPLAVVRSTYLWKRTSNRATNLYPFGKPLYFRRLLQLLLFAHAVYTAVLLSCVISVSGGSSFLWAANFWWSYPLSFVPLGVSLYIWGKLLNVYAVTSNIDMMASTDLIRTVQAHQDMAALEKDYRYLTFLTQQAEKVVETKQGQIERCSSIYRQLPKESRKAIEDAFRALATSPEKYPNAEIPGVISRKDCTEVIRCLRLHPGADVDSIRFLEDWFSTLDENRSGYLNFEHFKVLVILLSNLGVSTEKLIGIRDGRITKFFTTLDTDRDERISKDELHRVLQGMKPPLSDREFDDLFGRLTRSATHVSLNELRSWARTVQICIFGAALRLTR